MKNIGIPFTIIALLAATPLVVQSEERGEESGRSSEQLMTEGSERGSNSDMRERDMFDGSRLAEEESDRGSLRWQDEERERGASQFPGREQELTLPGDQEERGQLRPDQNLRDGLRQRGQTEPGEREMGPGSTSDSGSNTGRGAALGGGQ